MPEADGNQDSSKETPRPKRWRKALTWALLAARVLGIVSAVDAIMSSRTSQGAIAWGVSLNTFPYLAVPLYMVFGGRKLRDYAIAGVWMTALAKS